MSHRALYRQYRPATFSEMIGQEHITTILKNQVKSGTTAHAYLFAGTRGTGKTSAARILARAVNCEEPVDGEPCGRCRSCQISAGECADIIELDAASNTGVDDIRDIIEKARFMPLELKHKVYIIDEAHALTANAFNALLKTLEEPPPHVTFILATTEPHKIPATIISRCQRMDFHRLGVSDMVKRTEEVLQRENAHIERDGLLAIARAAEGGMRDCLSLADQCLSFCGNKVSTQDVYGVLGSMEDGFLFDMAEAVLSGDPARALELLDQVVRDGRDLKVFLHDLTQHMRSLLLTKLCGHCSDILDCTEDSMKRYEEQATGAGETRLLRCSELLLQAEGRLRTVTMPRALIESTLVRISRPEEKRTMDDLMERIEVLERQVREGTAAPRRTEMAEAIPIGEKPDADEYPCDYGFEEPPEPEDAPPFDVEEPAGAKAAPKPEQPKPARAAKPAETAGSMSPQKLWKAILDKLGETERTMAVSGMYGKGSAINGNVLEVAFESEIIYRMMSAPGALEKVNGAADKVAPGYTVRMTQKSGGDDIESTGRALFGGAFRIES
ncbi:MAG: DNA polymerase III subunit gamma/tau [Eubacteriales bacterium]|nr:DNA polymerase III subunit gamma/tau [Clostridiales bacterium]MDY5709191.1 DNA polymerase III subunit gamma/tau [Eubacteriales bacterium]